MRAFTGGRSTIALRLGLAIVLASLQAALAIYLALASAGPPLTGVGEVVKGKYLDKRVSLIGIVRGSVGAASVTSPLVITLRDHDGRGRETIRVFYRGRVPRTYGVGDHVIIDGRYDGQAFRGLPGTLLTDVR